MPRCGCFTEQDRSDQVAWRRLSAELSTFSSSDPTISCLSVLMAAEHTTRDPGADSRQGHSNRNQSYLISNFSA